MSYRKVLAGVGTKLRTCESSCIRTIRIRGPAKAVDRLSVRAYSSINDSKLPSEKESQRSEASKWFSTKMDSLQTALFTFGQTLNDVTGYSAIENLKKRIEEKEKAVVTTKEQLRAAKDRYTRAVNKRSMSQREVNELLQRKHNWSTADLERFTELYRDDHKNETEEVNAEAAMSAAEQDFEDGQAQLTNLISARYHEEQIWSDKIRRASTWGTWGLMGFNIVLFVVVQLGLEPWRRNRLVGNFELKVKEALDDWSKEDKGLSAHEYSPAEPALPIPLDSQKDGKLIGRTLAQRLSEGTVVLYKEELIAMTSFAVVTSVLLGVVIGLFAK